MTSSLALAPRLTDPVTDYAQAVLGGAVIAGKRQRQACERHMRDLAEGPARGLVWSPETAAYAISFSRFVRHSKGEWRGKPLVLDGWQQFVVGSVYGWLVQEEGEWRRRFRTAMLEIPKKNGKSTMCGYVGIFGLVADDEPGAEIYAAATARKQALLVFNEAKEMVNTSPELRKKIKISVSNLACEANYSKFEPISSDDNTGDGINPHYGIFDELHRLKSRALLAVLRQGMGSRRQPLFWIITTSGDDRPNTPYDEEHNYALKILEGALGDDSYFVFIACADEDDDPFEERTWAKANPSLGISVKLADMRASAAKARNSDAELADFKRFRLNVRSSDSQAAIKMASWKRNTAGPIDEMEHRGRTCHVAIDLSAKTDITTEVLLFPPDDKFKKWVILPRFWVPEQGMIDRASRDRVPYEQWVEKGFVRTTLGNRVDYNAVLAQLQEDAENFNMVDVTFDPWNAGTIEADCTGAGMAVVEFPQNTSTYSHPTKEFLGMILDAEFEHGGNPVLAWMASNLVLVEDHNGNKMPSKRKSTGRIDGIAGAIMALGRALGEDKPKELTKGFYDW